MDSGLDMWRQMRRTMHGVDWRNQLAAERIECDRVRMPPTFDAPTRAAADFSRLKSMGESGRIRAHQKYPEIALAEAVWGQPELRSAIQSLVIANVPAAEVCEKLNLQSSVLQVIEDLYFDVRPMLSAPSWIVSKVIAVEADAGRDDVAAQLRVLLRSIRRPGIDRCQASPADRTGAATGRFGHVVACQVRAGLGDAVKPGAVGGVHATSR